ncbi:MAG: helix-turn-helix domain-containing protein [Candidatus Heimdallarchaeota archaeon]|nr:helix-turn-helix domain-containing protein [Candidatus Heimdallarchaeota archaeon]
MISKVLNYLKEGGDARISTIARKLNIDEGTVEMLLRQLEELGYLKKVLPSDVQDECSIEKCRHCPQAKNCKPLLKAKYIIIDKKRNNNS